MIAGICWKTFCAKNPNHVNNLNDMGFKTLRIFLNLADLPNNPLLTATSSDYAWQQYIKKIYNELPDGMWAWTFEDFEKPFWSANPNDTFKDNIEFCKANGWLPILCAGHSEEQNSWLTRCPAADKWAWLKRFSKELGLFLNNTIGFKRVDLEIWNEPNECQTASQYSNVALHMCLGWKSVNAGKTHVFACDIRHQDYLDYILSIGQLMQYVDYISPHILTYDEWDSDLLDRTYEKVVIQHNKKLSLLEISPLGDMERMNRIVGKCHMYALLLIIRNSNIGTAFEIDDFLMYDFNDPNKWVAVTTWKMNWIKEFNKKYANESIDVIGDDDMKLNDTYSVGSRGVVVKFIQECMNEDYFVPAKLVVDGIFGTKTKEAVESYQKRNGLSGTGIADKTTMLRIIKQFPVLWDKLEANWAYGER